jgi:DMSO/TMAO reductase YedYZ molybdopterin-dependent catalytic subunit
MHSAAGQEQETLKNLTITQKWLVTGLIAGVVLIIGAAIIFFGNFNREEAVKWEVTLVGKSGEQKVLSYQEIRALPAQEAQGGFFTTVGVVNGPYEVKGVLLQDLCALVGGVTANDAVEISAKDGYSMIFDYKQLTGDIPTYDPVTIHELPHERQVVLLIYEQDGKPLSDSDGKPLRLAAVGSERLLTEGHNWVKWVNKIEVLKLD